MTGNPLYCVPFDTVIRAAKLMKNEDVGSVPVCADRRNKRLVGIVTDRDLVVHAVADDRDPDRTKLQEVMTPKPCACQPSDDLEKAIDAMGQFQIRRIPVVGRDGELIGIISLADLVAVRADRLEQTAELLRRISKPNTMHAA